MITIAQATEDIISNLPYIEEAMENDLINYSSLARYIKDEVEEKTYKEVNIAAISMALKRMNIKSNLEKTETVIKNAKNITVRSNLAEITIKNSDSLFRNLKKIFDLIHQQGTNNFLTISQGITESTIIMNNESREVISKILKNEKIITKYTGLSSITIQLPETNVRVPGVYYTYLKALAWNGINIVEAISTSNEITIIFFDKDIDHAFSVLKNVR